MYGHLVHDFASRLFDGLIDDGDVEFVLRRQFHLGRFQATCLFFFRFRSATNEPPNEFVPAWGQQKYQSSLWHSLTNLPRPLNVNFKENGSSLPERLLNWFARCAVPV